LYRDLDPRWLLPVSPSRPRTAPVAPVVSGAACLAWLLLACCRARASSFGRAARRSPPANAMICGAPPKRPKGERETPPDGERARGLSKAKMVEMCESDAAACGCGATGPEIPSHYVPLPGARRTYVRTSRCTSTSPIHRRRPWHAIACLPATTFSLSVSLSHSLVTHRNHWCPTYTHRLVLITDY